MSEMVVAQSLHDRSCSKESSKNAQSTTTISESGKWVPGKPLGLKLNGCFCRSVFASSSSCNPSNATQVSETCYSRKEQAPASTYWIDVPTSVFGQNTILALSEMQ